MSLYQTVLFRLKADQSINSYKLFNKKILYSFPHYWFRHSYKEIFEEETYKFQSLHTKPYIIDCGSNIGLSIIYFKTIYPEAKIIGFEPDGKIFELLDHNIKSFGYDDVTLHNKGVWISETSLWFHSEGSLGGAILDQSGDEKNMVRIDTVRLREFLDEKIDFLKIDIEGAEMDVLEDCKDKLSNVENIFVEYHCRVNEPQRLSALLEILTEAGFRYYIRQADETIRYPFIQKHGQYMDVQLNIFGFRNGQSAQINE